MIGSELSKGRYSPKEARGALDKNITMQILHGLFVGVCLDLWYREGRGKVFT
jgi:hypothetical protein